MKLLVFIAGLFVLVAAQQDDSPPDVLTIYSLITGGDDMKMMNETDVYNSTTTETDLDFPEVPEDNLEDRGEPETQGPVNGAPMRPPHSKPFGPRETMRRPGPGRFPPGPGRFQPGPGRFPSGRGRFPPGPGRFPPGPGRFPPGPGRFPPGPGRFPTGPGEFPPDRHLFPPRPRLECSQWSDWQKATCFWPNQTLEELPANCRTVPINDRWPSYLKKFVKAKVVEGYNMIMDEFKRRGSPNPCGFCSRSFECRVRNESSSSSPFCPMKEVRAVDENCGDSDACVISEEKGGCPPPLFLHKSDRLDNLRDMIQKKQYKKFAAHLLNLKKSEIDGKPENIRFKRAPGFGDDFSAPDLSFFKQMMEASMYDGGFNHRDHPFGPRGSARFTPGRFPGSNFGFNEQESFRPGYNAYEKSMPTGPQRNGPFHRNNQPGPFAAHYPRGVQPNEVPEGPRGPFSPLQDSPFVSAGKPGNAGLNSGMDLNKPRRQRSFQSFGNSQDDESGFRATEEFGPKPFGSNPFGPGPRNRFPSRRGPRGPRPFGPRPFGPSADFPFPQGPEGHRGPLPFGPRSFGPRPFGPRPFGPRPFGPSDDFPFPQRPEESFGPRPFGPSEDFPFPQRQEGPRGPAPFGPRPFGPSDDFPFPQGQQGPRPFGPSEDFPFPQGQQGPQRSRGPTPFGPRPFGPSDDFPFPQGQQGQPGPQGPRPFGPSEDFPFPQGQQGSQRSRGPSSSGPRPFGPSDDFQFPQGPRRSFGPADDFPFGSDDVRSSGDKPMPFGKPSERMAFGRRFARKPFNETGNFPNDREQLEAMKIAMFNHMRLHHQNSENEESSPSDGLIDVNMEVESRLLLANLLHGTTCAGVHNTCLCCCNHYVPNVETGKCEDLHRMFPGIENILENMDKDDTSFEQPAMPPQMKKKPMNEFNAMRKMEKPTFTSDF